MDPRTWQPTATVYQRAAEAGVKCSHVAPAAFRDTGLTGAVHRGARYLPADTVEERVARAREALAEPGSYVTVYYGDLDTAGHMHGWGGKEWLDRLAVVDRMAEQLAEALPPGSALYVTADHGMVNVTEKIDAEAVPALREGVRGLGGEARARHVYAEPGAAAAVLAAWRETLAGRAWVVSRQEAIDAGWFGPRVRAEWVERIGDVVAVPYTDVAIVDPVANPVESRFVGYHGALTPMEQLVPLLEASTR